MNIPKEKLFLMAILTKGMSRPKRAIEILAAKHKGTMLLSGTHLPEETKTL